GSCISTLVSSTNRRFAPSLRDFVPRVWLLFSFLPAFGCLAAGVVVAGRALCGCGLFADLVAAGV
ncbi:MAG: hypothetical protein P8N60_14565, partial [Burkholderiaceae bacterium]|nr:hypothetical protein [Burkholderiaceae bacterium]